MTEVSSAIYKHFSYLNSYVSQNPVICDVYTLIQMCSVSKTSVTYDIFTTYIFTFIQVNIIFVNKKYPKIFISRERKSPVPIA